MQKSKLARTIFLLLVLIIFWFLAVDISWFVEKCDDCFYDKDVFAFRLFTLPIYQIVREYDSPVSYTAEKLGVTCLHNNINRWHKQKWWGMLVCCRPCHSGIYRLSSSDNEKEKYKRFINENIKKLLETNPDLPSEFKQHVLIEHDMDYWKELKQKLLPQDSVIPQD
ncbi:MAG: hypothetical protein JSV82_03660 [Planctomycetota bacterium]|nr:MAG: hypothetical protein JSV82_03660 [Planctomycetota bacterium]